MKMQVASRLNSEVKRLCIIKTSSLGDVVHSFPAISDALAANPELEIDWIVEENFASLVAAHPGIRNVIPVALRRWRGAPLQSLFGEEFRLFRQALKKNQYDLVIDAQGLIKSALISTLIPAPVSGLDKNSIKESLASRFYAKNYAVPRQQHAVERVRQLFAQALGYDVPSTPPRYGLVSGEKAAGVGATAAARQIIFFHGTTWTSKHWPERYWRQLAALLNDTEYQVIIPWGSEPERLRAERIAAELDSVVVLEQMNLPGLLQVLGQVSGAFSVDTGLCHLAAAMEIPTVAFYGPTDPVLTGNYGLYQTRLKSNGLPCSPCLARECRILPQGSEIPPCFEIKDVAVAWQQLTTLMQERDSGNSNAVPE